MVVYTYFTKEPSNTTQLAFKKVIMVLFFTCSLAQKVRRFEPRTAGKEARMQPHINTTLSQFSFETSQSLDTL